MTEISHSTRQAVRRFCELYIKGMRALLKRNPPKDSPCRSCAFAPNSERWRGFESTIWHMIQAVTGDKPFYCHRNMKHTKDGYQCDPKNLIPCANYEAVRNSPELDRVLTDAAVESELKG